MDLNTFWFLMLGVLLVGYAVLDGFDLGVGALHLFARPDTERRVLLNSIGPVWDGNEVWLVTFGGALFAAFPNAYATAFSGFYLAFVILLFALIFRAAAIEFRSKSESVAWRAIWDWTFSVASVLALVLFGVAVGNVMVGLPIGDDMEFKGSFLTLLRPYPLLVGLMSLALFTVHGAVYLHLKTEGELLVRVRRWFWRAWWVMVVLYSAVTAVTITSVPGVTVKLADAPWVWLIVGANLLALVALALMLRAGKSGLAFLCSSAVVAALVALFGFAMFPMLVLSNMDPLRNSLSIYNAASSPRTLLIMRNIAFMGLPLVLCYTAIVYWVFRGKVRLHRSSY